MGYSPWGRKESDITEHTTPAKLYHLPHWEKAFFPEGRQDLMCPVFPYLVFLTLKKWPIRSQSSDHLCNLGLFPPASAFSSGRWENNPCLHSSQTAMEAPGTRVGPRTQSPSPMWAGLVGQRCSAGRRGACREGLVQWQGVPESSSLPTPPKA